MKQHPRKQLLVNDSVQLPIVLRVITYWASCMVFITCPLTLARVYAEPDVFILSQLLHVVTSYWPLYATMTTLLPFAIYDSLKLSNRFAGPIYRMKTTLQRFNEGEAYQQIQLRATDFHKDLATELNIAIATAQENARPEAFSINSPDGNREYAE